MSRWAMVFPGQGSQSVGMLQELADTYPVIKQTFDAASQQLGYDLWQLVSMGPVEQLNQTSYTQPALFVTDVAMWRCWCEQYEARPTILAGHSLGEYAALVSADVLSFEDALDLVVVRGLAMQESVSQDSGAMAAIVGLSDDEIQTICDHCAHDQVLSPANFNSLGQVVLAGHADAIRRAIDESLQRGAKLAKQLPVSVPSHCLLMQPAVDRLALSMDSKTWHVPTTPVIQNVDVKTHHDTLAIRQALLQQLTSPVQWVRTIQSIQAQGVSLFVECGPGKVLAGLIKRIDRQLKTLCINMPEDFAMVLNKFEEIDL